MAGLAANRGLPGSLQYAAYYPWLTISRTFCGIFSFFAKKKYDAFVWKREKYSEYLQNKMDIKTEFYNIHWKPLSKLSTTLVKIDVPNFAYKFDGEIQSFIL